MENDVNSNFHLVKFNAKAKHFSLVFNKEKEKLIFDYLYQQQYVCFIKSQVLSDEGWEARDIT